MAQTPLTPQETQALIERIETFVRESDEARELVNLRGLRDCVVIAIAGGHIRCDCPRDKHGQQEHDPVCIIGKHEAEGLAMRARWERNED